jgi:hypothetical protein
VPGISIAEDEWMRSILAIAVGLIVAVASLGSASAGVSGPAFYVDGTIYRTVGTPTDFSGAGAPGHSFDIIYDLGGLQLNVAEAAPGDRDYNGGRWMVHAIAFSNYAGALNDNAVDLNDNGVLDSDTEVLAAIAHGYAIDTGVVKLFECPAIKMPDGGS